MSPHKIISFYRDVLLICRAGSKSIRRFWLGPSRNSQTGQRRLATAASQTRCAPKMAPAPPQNNSSARVTILKTPRTEAPQGGGTNHPYKLTVEVAICHKAYNQTGLKAPTRTREGQTTKIATMPEPLMCLVGRCILSRHNQMETTEKLMAAKDKKFSQMAPCFWP